MLLPFFASIFSLPSRGANLLATENGLIAISTFPRGLFAVTATWFRLVAFQLPPLAS